MSTGAAAANGIISIHAPREGSDQRLLLARTSTWVFLSTLPARGATRWVLRLHRRAVDISIHAPREGSDGTLLFQTI